MPSEAGTDKLAHSSVAETVACLIAQVEARGLRYVRTIDHSAEARAVGLELRETQVVVFGNPHVGTPIMQAVPLAGLDLPLKVLVREDRDRTCVGYTAPAELAARYRLPAELPARARGIDELTDAASANSAARRGLARV
jgi:uncharacterized protein (DUF302 family)